MRERSDRDEVYAGRRDRPGPSRGSTPPLASSVARPATCSTDRAQLGGRHVVEQQPRRTGVERLVDLLARSRHSTSSGTSGIARRAPARSPRPTPPAIVDVVLLDQDLVPEPDAVVDAAAGDAPRPSRAAAGPASSCACRGSARPCPRRRARSARSCVATPLRRCEQVQRACARPASSACASPVDRAAPARRSRQTPSGAEALERDAPVERAEDVLGGLEPEDDARLLLRDRRPRPRAAAAPSRRRQVAGADVLGERRARRRPRARGGWRRPSRAEDRRDRDAGGDRGHDPATRGRPAMRDRGAAPRAPASDGCWSATARPARRPQAFAGTSPSTSVGAARGDRAPTPTSGSSAARRGRITPMSRNRPEPCCRLHVAPQLAAKRVVVGQDAPERQDSCRSCRAAGRRASARSGRTTRARAAERRRAHARRARDPGRASMTKRSTRFSAAASGSCSR